MADDRMNKEELADDELEEVVGGLKTRTTGEKQPRLVGTFGEPREVPSDPSSGPTITSTGDLNDPGFGGLQP